ncbi:myrosinase 1-like [Chironomus tepperi]|uniref:myrosinase 1-like n=1 Tax=Chironomus tepperi TaxID=113505 RepID=UPI00391FA707
MGSIKFGVILLLSACSFISGEEYTLPDSFIFGAATASYQIEGAWNVDGKLPSIWDTATHRTPWNGVVDNSTGDEAALSYYYWKKDIEALKNANLTMYRFSIAWTRVLTKDQQVNQKGIDYYNTLINDLLAEGIEPMVTLYHWDLPQYLQDIGGWMNYEVIKYYEVYADLVFKSFGDRVKIFITFNEPSVFCDQGYSYVDHAPHIWTYDSIGGILCSHHVLISHARAYKLYKEKYFPTQQGKVGICLNTGFSYRGNGSVTMDTVDRSLQFYFGRYAHPIFSEIGDYPKVMRDAIDQKSKDQGRLYSRLPTFTPEEIEMLKGSADFLALNYYSSSMVVPIHFWGIDPLHHDSEAVGFHDSDWKQSRSSWLFQVPQGLYDLLNWIREQYNNPNVYISENGWSDAPLEIEDDGRIEYMRLHLAAISKAITDGCNVLGITVWSLVDNFEWMRGYDERFGIYAIDLNDPQRTRIPKKSVSFLRNVTITRTVEAEHDDIFVVKVYPAPA